MKRSKKRNETVPGQLCLFELPGIRQEEERRTNPKKKPAEALKTAAPTLIPPAPVEAVKTPENALKTEMPDRQELNRTRKENPEALHTLNRMNRDERIITGELSERWCLEAYKSRGHRGYIGNWIKKCYPAPVGVDKKTHFNNVCTALNLFAPGCLAQKRGRYFNIKADVLLAAIRKETSEVAETEALKTASPILVPPASTQALKTPENALKTEMPDRQELNRTRKENPEALHTLNRMARKKPDVFTWVCRFALVPLCLVLLFFYGRSSGSGDAPKEEDPAAPTAAPTIEQAVSFLALAEGWHDPQKTGCTGWGHRICYDNARAVTPAEADSLATSDLKALSARFRPFQGDSLLLALLAYNVGVKAVKTSSLVDSLTFEAYTSFCYIQGKRSERQYQRRRAEWVLFKIPQKK